jgi:hypothetical protein
MGKPSAPPPIDYAANATAQGAANKETAISEFQLNNANQDTPWGSTRLTGDPNDPSSFMKTTTLNPADQARLDQSRALQAGLLGLGPAALKTAENALGSELNTGNLPPMAYQVDAQGGKKLDFSGLPGQVYDVGDTGDIRNRMENAAWGKYIDRAAPMMQQQTDALNTRLANMGGVTSGSAAQRQQAGLQASQGDQARQAIFDSILQGGNAAQQEQGMRLNSANLWNQGRAADAGLLQTQTGFNNQQNQQDIQNAFANASLTNAARGQGLQEASNLRQMPINELMAMLSGSQVNQPTFQQNIPTNIQPAPIMQGAQLQGQQDQANYAQQMGAWNNMIGGLTGMGSSAIKMSDRRLKSAIVRVGMTPGGVPLYEYDIFGRRERGVMAQDMLIVRPSAVSVHPDGYLMVDYAQVP